VLLRRSILLRNGKIDIDSVQQRQSSASLPNELAYAFCRLRVGIARVLSVCRMSVVCLSVCYNRGLWSNGVRQIHAYYETLLEVDIGLSESATKFDLG